MLCTHQTTASDRRNIVFVGSSARERPEIGSPRVDGSTCSRVRRNCPGPQRSGGNSMLRRLSLLLPLALAITMATVPGAAAQPVSVVDANRVMHAAGALSDRIRAFHSGPGSWQGTRPLPADYCATMRAGEAALQDLTRLANKAILYRMIALARPLQRAADRLGDQLD